MPFFPESTSDMVLNLSTVPGTTVTDALDSLAGAAAQDLASVLTVGNITGGTDLVITSGDKISTINSSPFLDADLTLSASTIGGIIKSTSMGADSSLLVLSGATSVGDSADILAVLQTDVAATNSVGILLLNNATHAGTRSLKAEGTVEIIPLFGGHDGLIFSAVQTTTGNVISAQADGLTTGSIISAVSNSADASARDMVFFHNDNVLATDTTVLTLQQDSTGNALAVSGKSQFDGDTLTTATAATLFADNLTTGGIIHSASASADTGTRTLNKYDNTNAASTGTTLMQLNQSSTGLALDVNGNVDITGKLTVSGLIDPTGLVLDEQATVPAGPTATKGTVWVRNDTPNSLVFTDDGGTDHDLSGTGVVDTLAEVLASGNTTGGTSIVISSGDSITATGINTVIDINSTATTLKVLDITADSSTTAAVLGMGASGLTTASMVDLYSNSVSTATRSLLYVQNDSPLATGCTVAEFIQDSTGLALNIVGNVNTASSSTTADVQTTIANALTTGSALSVSSTSADVSTRNLVHINQSVQAAGTTALRIDHADNTALSVGGGSVFTGPVEVNKAFQPTTSAEFFGDQVLFERNVNAIDSSAVVFRKSRGTNATPTAVLANDFLGRVDFLGYDGTVYAGGGELKVHANENFTGSAHGTRMEFYATLTGTTSEVIHLTLKDENVVVGDGAIATTATDGFLYIPTLPGAPTGVPTTFTGREPIVIDSANSALYFYDGGWLKAGDVVGPGTVVATSLTKFSGTSGKAVDDIAWATDTTSGNTDQLTFTHQTASVGEVGLRFIDQAAGNFALIQLVEATKTLLISNGQELELQSTAADIRLDSAASIFLEPGGNSSVDITAVNTTVNVLDITANSLTSGKALNIATTVTTGDAILVTANGLTTGRGLCVDSNSADVNTRNVVEFVNNNPLAVGAKVLTLRQDADAQTLAVSSSSTTKDVVNIANDVLTTGTMLNVISNSASASSRFLVDIVNDNTAATAAQCLRLTNDAIGGVALNSVGRHVLKNNPSDVGNTVAEITAAGLTTGTVLSISGNDLTTGGVARFYSNSATTDTRSVVSIINDNNASVGTTALSIQQDANQAAIAVNMGGVTTDTGIDITGLGNLTTGRGFNMFGNSAGGGYFLSNFELGGSASTNARAIRAIHSNDGFAFDADVGRIKLGGSIEIPTTTVSAATHSLAKNESFLDVAYTVTGAVTITLTTAQSNSGRDIVIKDGGLNAHNNNITIQTEGAQLIDGAATFPLTQKGEAVRLRFNGTDWRIY